MSLLSSQILRLIEEYREYEFTGADMTPEDMLHILEELRGFEQEARMMETAMRIDALADECIRTGAPSQAFAERLQISAVIIAGLESGKIALLPKTLSASAGAP